METKSRAKARMSVVVSRTTIRSLKHPDLQQKVSRWMVGAQSPSKLQTQVFVVEGCYSSDFSSPALKQAF